MIQELHAQIDAVRDKLALAQRAGNPYEANLYRARLADLMDIAARHGIDLTAPAPTVGRHPQGLGRRRPGARQEPGHRDARRDDVLAHR